MNSICCRTIEDYVNHLCRKIYFNWLSSIINILRNKKFEILLEFMIIHGGYYAVTWVDNEIWKR